MEGGIKFRVAHHEDYESILKIHDNVYGGLDYMPSFYHQLLDKKDTLAVVAVNQEDKLVAMDMAEYMAGFEGKWALTRAARVHPDYQGQGLYQRLNTHLKQLYRDLHPDINSILYCTMDNKFQEHRRTADNDKFTMLASYHVFALNISAVNGRKIVATKEFEDKCISSFNTEEETGSLDKLVSIIEGPVFMSELWTPTEKNKETIKQVISTHHTLVTRHPNNQSEATIQGMSFIYHYHCKYGRNCLLYYHGDDSYLEEHIMKQLKFVLNELQEENVSIVGQLEGTKDMIAVGAIADKYGFGRGPHQEGLCVVMKHFFQEL